MTDDYCRHLGNNELLSIEVDRRTVKCDDCGVTWVLLDSVWKAFCDDTDLDGPTLWAPREYTPLLDGPELKARIKAFKEMSR